VRTQTLCCAAGLIRKLTGGLYTFLPLDCRRVRKIEQIVREEMNRAGAGWNSSHAGAPTARKSGNKVAATNGQGRPLQSPRPGEEGMVLGRYSRRKSSCPRPRVAGEINSYRQLPEKLYQIQNQVPR